MLKKGDISFYNENENLKLLINGFASNNSSISLQVSFYLHKTVTLLHKLKLNYIKPIQLPYFNLRQLGDIRGYVALNWTDTLIYIIKRNSCFRSAIFNPQHYNLKNMFGTGLEL